MAAQLGGLPRLPDSEEWPTWPSHGPLSFVASINCAALASGYLDIWLPTDGELLFFYFDGQVDNHESTVGFWDPPSLQGARLLYVPAGHKVAPRAAPDPIVAYPQVDLRAEMIVTYPMFEHPDLEAAFRQSGEDVRSFLNHPVNADSFVEELDRRLGGPRHQVGGYAWVVQAPVEFEVATASLGGKISHTDPALKDEVLQWTLLAQWDTDDDAKMMWGDVGTLYWLARKIDLQGGDVSRASFTWQCG